MTGSQGKSNQTLEVRTPESLGQETEKARDKGHDMQQEAVKLTGKQSEKKNTWVTNYPLKITYVRIFMCDLANYSC